MKQGRPLDELAKELMRQADKKRDFVVPTKAMRLVSDGDGVALEMKHQKGKPTRYTPTPHFHNQLAAKLDIPRRYYGRMLDESRDLLLENANHWLNENPMHRLIRTLDGDARAYLSPRFRELDNAPLCEAILPRLGEMKGVKVVSSQVTATRLYIKVVNEKMEGEVVQGDVVQAGLVISNSEVGAGSLRVDPLIYRLVCTNGMISATSLGKLKRNHVGSSLISGGPEDFAWNYMRDETRELADRAFFAEVADFVESAFNRAMFEAQVARLRQAKAQVIDVAVEDIIEVTAKAVNLSDSERKNVLTHLAAGGDLSLYGISNAITRMSQDIGSYDRATELERIGGVIIESTPSAVRRMLKAA